MKCNLFIILVVAVSITWADKRPQFRQRGGRQLDLETGYGAPADASYGAPVEEETVLDLRSEELPGYEEEALDTYEASESRAADAGLDMLMKAVPGIPGEDYPIYAEAPETEWSCEGQVNGGYYADPSAECQVFHICSDDGTGNLLKYSFLCPNGTIFNQENFVCDWWFNVDCSEAEALAEARNAEIQSEREAAEARLAAEASAPAAYGAPLEDRQAEEPIGNYESAAAAGSYLASADYY